jgi:gliding motility-associated-like protein
MKTIPFLFTLVTLSFTLQGQNWMAHAGGAGNDEALDITQNNQGGFLISGFYSYASTFNTTTLSSVGEIDGFLASTNAVGDVQWVKQFGGTGSDAVHANDIDSDGNIFVSGYYSGTMTVDGTTLSSNQGSQDIFLAKLDPAGNLIWIRDFGGVDHDFLYDLGIDQSGNAVITGKFKGTVTIGAETYISAIDPEDNGPSYDIFVVKYDAAGTVLWSKHGRAKYDDRGTGIAINASNEIALIGQFSDTLYFDNTYLNQVFNTGFVMLMDSDGDELWMRKMSASMCVPYDITFYQDTLMYVTGDFTGQLAVFAAPLVTTTSSFQSKVFLLKMNTQGDVLWLENDGSNSSFSSRAVAVDPNGNAMLTGYFRCRLDEYSQQHGDGVFYSAGRRDIFITQYSSGGTRMWERQFGGPGDDVSWDLVAGGTEQPVIAGAFSKYFHAPNGGDFLVTGWTPPTQFNLPNGYTQTYCSDNLYGAFSTIESTGHQDILLAKPLDLSRQPYDFFSRFGAQCNRDFLTPCINNSCPDTVQSCSAIQLLAKTFTGTDGFIGPRYDYLWSTGSDNEQTTAQSSGEYWLQVTREDGCYTYSDTITVIIHPVPTKPHISDDVVVNTESFFPDRIFSCYPDTVHLEMGNVDTINNYYGWSTSPGIISHFGLDTTATTSAVYHANHISPFGCKDSTSIEVRIDDWANEDTLQPHILVGLDASSMTSADTLYVCQGQEVYYLTMDSLHYQSVGFSMPYFSSDWSVNFSTGGGSFGHFDWEAYEPEDFGNWMMGHYFIANQSSWVTLDVELTDYCNDDTSTYFLHHEFYLDVSGFSVQEFGPHRMCPGDTIEIGINGGDFHDWDGPLYIGPDTLNTLAVIGEGVYSWETSILTPSGGYCMKTDTFRVLNLEAPDITMIPSHGVICPNDSVLMIAPDGSDYQWIGPNNAVIGSTQTIYANTPGFYFCQFVNPEGCYLISNEVEVRGFNSPYMFAEPQQTICEGGVVTLTVVANEGSILDWPPPLIDNVFEQDIYQAGYYEVAATFCGITDTISITVIDVSPEVNLNIAGFDTICAGEILMVNGPSGYYSYQWSNGSQETAIEVTETGIYFLTAENFDGCIGHSDTLFVEVLPAPEPPLLSDTVICFGGDVILYDVANLQPTYWFDSQLDSLGILPEVVLDSVTETTTYFGAYFNGQCFSLFDTSSVTLFEGVSPPQITGSNVLCPSDSLLLSTSVSSILTYWWVLPDSSTLFGDEITLFIPDPGIYWLYAEHPVCGIQSDSIAVQLILSADFTIEISIGEILNCDGDSVYLEILGEYDSVAWLPSMSSLDSILVLEESQIWATIIDPNGCELTTDTVEIQFQEPPAALSFTVDTVCSGETASLVFATSYNLFVDTEDGPSPASIPYMTSSLTSDTTYTFYLQDNIGCVSEPLFWNVEVTQVPASLEIWGDTLLCSGFELILSAAPFSEGEITFIDQNSVPLGTADESGQLILPNITSSNSGDTITAVLDIDGCVIMSDIHIVEVVDVPEQPFLITVGSSCPEDTLLIFASDSSDLGHLWTGPNGFTSTESLLVFDPLTANEEGTYSLRVTSSICTSDTSSIDVWLSPSPNISLIGDTVICAGEFIDLFLDESFELILWSTNETSDIISVSDSGIYWVLVTNEFGCSDTDTTLVETINCNTIVSNIITPNGDGFNDYFTLEADGLRTMEVEIYNRLGRLIYHWDVLDGKWDGTIQNNGFDVSEGTYYFIGSYLDISGNRGIKKGFIQVIR